MSDDTIEENGADPSSFADFVDHEEAARTGEEIPEEPRDTLPMGAAECAGCGVPLHPDERTTDMEGARLCDGCS